MGQSFVYMMVNHKNGTIYVGSTTDIRSRVQEHKTKAHPNSFTAKYGCDRLVYVEVFDHIRDARTRENAQNAINANGKSTSSKPTIPNGTISHFSGMIEVAHSPQT